MRTKIIALAALGALLTGAGACGTASPTAPSQANGGMAGGGLRADENGGMAGSGGYTAPPPNGGMAGSGG